MMIPVSAECLATVRTSKYMAGNGSFKSPPPTQNSCQHHLKWVCLATHVMNNYHVAKPELPYCIECAWQGENISVVPVTMSIESCQIINVKKRCRENNKLKKNGNEKNKTKVRFVYVTLAEALVHYCKLQ